MGPLGGVVLGHVLVDRDRGHPAVGVGVDGCRQRGDASCLQPLGSPWGQVAAGGALKRCQEVDQRRVAPCVAREVASQPLDEGVRPDPGVQLLQHAGTLGVGDAVEVGHHRLGVGHVGHDRVGRGQLVLLVGPGLHRVGEVRPGVFAEARRLRHRGVGDEGGEGLVEPQVVPPAHGDQVAEPHVGHLVQDRVGP